MSLNWANDKERLIVDFGSSSEAGARNRQSHVIPASEFLSTLPCSLEYLFSQDIIRGDKGHPY